MKQIRTVFTEYKYASTIFISILMFIISPLILKSQSFLPSNIVSLKLWLAADSGTISNNGAVAQWNDLSGNNYHLLQPTASLRPTLIDSALCGKPVVRFDGIDDWLYAGFGQGFAQGNSFFVVWRISDTTGTTQNCYSSSNITGRHDLKWNNNSVNMYAGNQIGYTKPIPFDFIITSAIYNGANSKIFENGLLKNTGNAGTQNIFDVFLGKSGLGAEGYLNGDIAEIIFYNESLHDTDRVNVEQYLLNKYSPGVSLGIDVFNSNFCETVLEAHSCSNNYLWSTGATTPSITVNQAGTYWVMAADIFGYLSIDSVNVFFTSNQMNDTVICMGDTINVSTNLQNPYTFLWSTGDTLPDIDIYNAGLYWVRITDTLGCYIVDTFHVNIDSMAYSVGFSADTLFICEGTSLGLANGANLVTSYMWSNGSTDSVLYIFSSGIYCVTMTNVNGCSSQRCVYVNVSAAPVANFSYSDSLCINFPIVFTDLSFVTAGDSILYWLWEFGDGNYSTQQNPIHTYSNSGNYIVTLIVENQDGCMSSYSDTLQIASVCITGIDELEYNMTIYPNPSGDYAILIFNSAKAQHLQIFVYDRIGQEMFILNKSVEEGVNNIPMNTQELSQGTYFLRITDGFNNIVGSIMFVK
ncbi:MAG: PKD domain-containing protein [Bacteroidales bacterium]|nr:PKD domain-containing protein [Bacteroidales bacterium]